jgi:putative transposase
MKKRAAGESRNQGCGPSLTPLELQQLVLPMMVASEALKKGLLACVQQIGMLAFRTMLEAEAEEIAGPKGKHAAERTYHHWGTARTPLPFGGRHVVVERPRVRAKGKGGKEVELPSVSTARSADPMPAHVAEQVLVGVSTRGYERSLEPLDESLESRGESKSNVSRALVAKTTEKLGEFLDRKLDEVALAAMFIDGIDIGGHAVILALGVTKDGTKVPLGVWCGSTENHVVTAALMQNLIERGLRVDAPLLFVIDGGKGIRKALNDVFGTRAVVQRCQVHKMRNVRDHLPEERRAYVSRQMHDAYKSRSAKTAKKLLLQLVSWLEANGEDAAAASLREGLDETLTVLRLGLPATLCRTFGTTNAIENLNSTVRRVIRNVKRWRGESMIQRWVALGVTEAQRSFRRVKGHGQMNLLLSALSPNTEVVRDKKVA